MNRKEICTADIQLLNLAKLIIALQAYRSFLDLNLIRWLPPSSTDIFIILCVAFEKK